MMPHDTTRLDAIPRKTLAMGSESLRKTFADDELKRAIGRAIERALDLAGMQKGEAAAEMGYGTNQAPLSRWIAGTEPAQLAKLFSVPALRAPLVIALAQLTDDAQIVTTISIRRAG